MHRVILTILLTAISSSALAEWVKAGMDKSATVYVDTSTITISKKSKTTEVWHVLDYETVQDSMGTKYLSAKVRMGYDCKKMKSRNLGLTWHSGNMGEGEKVISRSTFGEWRRPFPGSLEEALLEIVCEKK